MTAPSCIGHRILARAREAAETLLLDGAIPWDVDAAMVAFGYHQGPFEAQDLSGLDIAYLQRKEQAATRDPAHRYIPILDQMVRMGRLGKKAGVGWYRYPGGGGAVEDPLLEDLIAEESYFAKITRREFTQDEICERVLMAMINEAAMLLDQGFSKSPAEIDEIMVREFGFPQARGGVLRYGDTLGAARILQTLETYRQEDPFIWRPSAIIRANAATETRFYAVGN